MCKNCKHFPGLVFPVASKQSLMAAKHNSAKYQTFKEKKKKKGLELKKNVLKYNIILCLKRSIF